MKAALFRGKDTALQVEELKKPKPVKDQVLVRMKYAALNHRDLWLIQEESQHYPAGIILGSDGCGIVEDVGEDADPLLVGAEVVINPSLDWGNNPLVQGDTFHILGFPTHGTLAEYVVISKKYIFEKPDHLSFEESAAVPLAGLTAYRALFTKGRLRSHEKVLITGIGGGAALWAMQFALAYKARVYVTSGSEDKLLRAKEMGALAGYNYKGPDWHVKAKKDAGGFDIIIDSAGGNQFSRFIDLAVPGGRIVNFGRTGGNITDIPTRALYSKQISIFGTTMGTRDEFLSMLYFLESRNIRPVIDKTFRLDQIAAAFQRMEKADQFGKIIIEITK